MSGHQGTGGGRALVTCGYLAVGSCRRGKPLFGCRVTGCVGREVGCGSRGTGSSTVDLRLSVILGINGGCHPPCNVITERIIPFDDANRKV